ncbi:MAG: hypothetical protein WAU31_03490, partial [Candidatus Moraniibacteriota bacterium]
DALHIAQAVGQVLTERNALFRSGDEKSVEIRTLSGPIVEKNPGMSTLPLAFLGGLISGMLLRFSWIFVKTPRVFPEEARISPVAESQKSIASQGVSSPVFASQGNTSDSDGITFHDW